MKQKKHPRNDPHSLGNIVAVQFHVPLLRVWEVEANKDGELIGEALVKAGVLERHELRYALEVQGAMRSKRPLRAVAESLKSEVTND